MWQPFLFCAGIIPALVLLAFVSIDRWRRKQRGERTPLEKLLRPAGYSLQCKLEDLHYDFTIWFMAAFVFALLVIFFPQTRPGDVSAPFVAVVMFGSIAAVCATFALRKLYKIRFYRMGLLGEQAIAEELQQLLTHGYKVFHDLSKDGKDNIDHVVVGSAGVFAIETKYRTKKPGKKGARDYEATFDGTKIRFPTSCDNKTLEQATRNARWLAETLSGETGVKVMVEPIVALPGWLVRRTENFQFKVLSGKEISSHIEREPAKLSEKTIKQIVYQLDKRCRNVEF